MAFAKIESTYTQGNRGLKSGPVSSGVGVAEDRSTILGLRKHNFEKQHGSGGLIYGNL